MRKSMYKLSYQLLILILLMFMVVIVLLGLILPNTIVPIAEQNLYSYLSQPLSYMNQESSNKVIDANIGYIYILEDQILTTQNVKTITNDADVEELLEKTTGTHGKIKVGDRDYYYTTNNTQLNLTIVAITDNDYINDIKQSILNTILPIILITFTIIAVVLIAWSGIIVRKIEKLKLRVDNFDDDSLSKTTAFEIDDEIRSLSLAIEDMRNSLKNQEEYRNQMYQNISHDFKTPLTVIKSYIEAAEDGVEETPKALEIIKSQTDNLEQKVHSLLYLNKLDYLKDSNDFNFHVIDIEKIIDEAITKFKFQRKDIDFIKVITKNNSFVGTNDLFETIIENILQNFTRYAEKEIKITVKNNKIVLYNDGRNIDPEFLEAMFTPFRKGIKGEFGLGLSIVKKSLNLMNYNVVVKNHKKGVSFTIYKATK